MANKKKRKQEPRAPQTQPLENLLRAEAVLYGQVCWSIANRGTDRARPGDSLGCSAVRRRRVIALLMPIVALVLMASDCGYLVDPIAYWAGAVHTVEWLADGSGVVFSDGDDLVVHSVYSVASDGSRLDLTAAGWREDDRVTSNISPRVSPDGSRIAYAAYRDTSLFSLGGHDWEIYSSRSDGSDQRRLTKGGHNVNPAWSPDGTRIAFLSYRDGDFKRAIGRGIYTMAPDGSDVRAITKDVAVGNLPPTQPTQLITVLWSPSSRHIAFVGVEAIEGTHGYRSFIYTVRPDGSERHKLMETASLPAWSPDGEHLAFAGAGEEDAGIYTVRPDGSGLRRVTALESENGKPAMIDLLSWSPDGRYLAFVMGTREEGVAYTVRPDGTDLRPVVDRFAPSQVSWSPDGPALLLVADGAYVFRPDDGSLRRVIPYYLSGRAGWSPDGSRIAIYDPERMLATVRSDGSDLRILARWTPLIREGPRVVGGGELVAGNPVREEAPVDLTACAAGLVVPEPEANAGLVGGCETLLGLRDTLAGSATLNWDGSLPLTEWEGVIVEGAPLRVRELALQDRGLTGSLPPELGRLTALRTLDLTRNELTGPLPPELGNLTELEVLNLAENYLSGAIPPELGELTRLRTLDLAGNALAGSVPSFVWGLVDLRILYLGSNLLTGPIPAELGRLAQLGKLGLRGNDLTGHIPPELGELSNLRELILSSNRLTGNIPPELGELSNLRTLYLQHNDLTGSIPPELGRLRNLRSLLFTPNDLNDCVPAELPDVWVGQSGWKRCEPVSAASP